MTLNQNDFLNIQVPPNIRVSENGRLFLVGGNHHVLTMFGPDGVCPSKNIDNFFANHESRQKWCKDRRISFSQWIFPDPIVFQGTMSRDMVSSIFLRSVPREMEPEGVFYPLSILDGQEARQSWTDTHYSPIGNLHLAAYVAEVTTGFSEPEELVRLESLCAQIDGFEGDLGVQCTPAVTECRRVPPQIKGIRSASNGLQAGNNGIIQLVLSPNARSNRKLLIFGDSFFRSMLPELARYWQQIVFLRTAFFHYEMVEAVGPNDILCGMAERYFPSSTPDADRPHFLAYPLVLGRGLAPDASFPELWSEIIDQRLLAAG